MFAWRWSTQLVLLAFAIGFTWPAILGGSLLGHHPDAAGTAWFLETSSRWILALADDETGWPMGATYGRPDSFLLALFSPLAGIFGPVRVLGWLTALGTFVSAWAAERFARELGATAPWSWGAGVVFAGSGLASTAMIEGYPYHVVNPWMPLMATAWFRVNFGRPSTRAGVETALWFVLGLLNTAWFAIASIPILLGFWFAGLWTGAARQSASVRATVAAVATVCGPILVYGWSFHAGGGAGADDLETAGFPAPDLGQTLLRMAPASWSVDLFGYSQSASLPLVALALVVLAPRVLRDVSEWKGVAFTGVVVWLGVVAPSLVLAMRHTTTLDLSQGGVASVVLAAVLRFPDRLGWGALLCVGAVAARSLTAVSGRAYRGALVLLGLIVLESFASTRTPWRQREDVVAVPSAYGRHSGPVLDVWPVSMSKTPAWDLWTTNMGCYYQTVHGRPIADLCLVSPGETSPRLILQAEVLDALLAGRGDEVAADLAAFGFTSVVAHTGLMNASDRGRIERALASWGTDWFESDDGGEHVVTARIPGTVSASRSEARGDYLEWLPRKDER